MNDLKFTTAGDYMEPDYEPDDGPLTPDQLNQIRKLNMNEKLKALAVEAGAPVEVLNTLWFNIFCQKFAHLLVEELEKDNHE